MSFPRTLALHLSKTVLIRILAVILMLGGLAAALDLWGWQVTRVRSCTFPSRPEPREATWSDALGRPQMQYWYEPDLEVRALESLAYDPEGRSLEVHGARGPGDGELNHPT